jgi:nicotinate-nucleotide pyrophosphorylase
VKNPAEIETETQDVAAAKKSSDTDIVMLDALANDIIAFEEAELAVEAENTDLTSDELPEDERGDDEHDTVAANLTPNAWVQSRQNGVVSKVRVAAVIKHSDKVVLVNRNGSRAATLSRKELAQQLRSGEMTIIENGMFFDRALETVIQNLRK